MDTIGLGKQISLPTLPTPSVPSAPTVSTPAPAPSIPLPGQGEVEYDAKTAEQVRAETVIRTAEQLANVFVLGENSVALFKDSTGQLITRYTNQRDGKVTYVPEPTLFNKLGGGGSSVPLLKIQA